MLQNRRPKIYLAGPHVFLKNAKEEGQRLKSLCELLGAEGLFPLDNELKGALDLPNRIRVANMNMIWSCDIVVADLSPFRGPGMDAGTAYEVGAANALGKIVVGYSADMRPYTVRVGEAIETKQDASGDLWDANGLLVENFDEPLIENLMIAKGLHGLFANPEDAIRFSIGCFRPFI